MCRSSRVPDGPRTCSTDTRHAFGATSQALANLVDEQQSIEHELQGGVPAPTMSEHFENLGYVAAQSGGVAAPSLNSEVMAALKGRAVGDPQSQEIMAAYSRGHQRHRDEQAAAALAEPQATSIGAFEHAGAEAARTGGPMNPLNNPSVMTAVEGLTSDSADTSALLSGYFKGYRNARNAIALAEYGSATAAEQKQITETRGSKAYVQDAPELVSGHYRLAMQGATNDTQYHNAWHDKHFRAARALYGPGTARTRIPDSLPEPSTMPDRDLQMMENDLFYLIDQRRGQPAHLPAERSARAWLSAARREIVYRDLTPKPI